MDIYTKGARLFKALGDPKRVMIIDMLSCGELCACRIQESFDMSQSTLSHHMKMLCECGLVNAREDGKWTFYSLNQKVIESMKQLLGEITTVKKECICNCSATGKVRCGNE